MTKIAVVALGGNALTRAGQSGSYDEMVANAAAMATAVNDVLEAGWRVVVVHGNGPQVGNLAIQQEAALQQAATAAVPAQPLALLGAMTQGMLGSVIARAIDLLRGRGTAAALVTHVTVDPADPAFGAPSKPIGPFFEPAEAERLARLGGWVVKPDSGRGYRRVVASPQPLAVIEIEAMRALVEAGAGHRGGRRRDPGAGRGPVPGRGRGHRQGPGRLPHRPAARRPGPAPGHRGGPGDARLRHAGGVEPEQDFGRPGGQVPGRGPVPAGEHGSQDRVGAALPRRRGRARGDHLARPAGGDAGRSRRGGGTRIERAASQSGQAR